MADNPQQLPAFGATDVPVWAPLPYARRVFVEILASMFSDPAAVGPFPDRWTYKEDENGDPTEDSKIVIAEVFAQDQVQQEPRPILVVRASSLRPQERDFQEGKIEEDLQTGERVYLFRDEIDVAVQVWTRQETECALLSSAVHSLLLKFRPIIVECGMLTSMGLPQLDAPIPMQEDSEVYHFVAAVQFRVTIDVSWSLRPTELKMFNHINVRVIGRLTGSC